MIIWVKVFKNGPSKICGRQPMTKQTISLQISGFPIVGGGRDGREATFHEMNPRKSKIYNNLESS